MFGGGNLARKKVYFIVWCGVAVLLGAAVLPRLAALPPAVARPSAPRVARVGSSIPRSAAPPAVPVCAIQGSGFESPYAGQVVRTRGVVHADFDEGGQQGFFLQEPGCDGKDSTSDGLFVYLGLRLALVEPGDDVVVVGVVQEYFGQTELRTSPDSVTTISSENPLPVPTDLHPPFEENAARVYFESLEGMRVGLSDGRVVGPSSAFGETWLIRSDLGLLRVFEDDPLGTGEVVTVDDEGPFALPPARVGERRTGLVGALAYESESYRLWLTQAPDPLAGASGPDKRRWKAPRRTTVVSSAPWSFTVAAFNLANLFDTADEPGRDDPIPSAAAYQRQLGKLARAIHEDLGEPTLVGIQEAENVAVLQELLLRPEITADYGVVLIEGPDARGIDVGLLYRTDRVRIEASGAHQACTALVDGLGPDGNRDPQNPQNTLTCDVDGDGKLDGNRLFSRPPLVVRLRICSGACPGDGEGRTLTLIINHWKSKSQDTPWNEYTLPRRAEQASWVAGLAAAVRATYPGEGVIVLGDLNDTPASEPLRQLAQAGFDLSMGRIPRAARYTYIYQGVSQVLDYILVDPSLADELLTVHVPHINADFPAVFADVPTTSHRSSDHDPVIARFTVFPSKTFLPLGVLRP